jgi:hypothetical protein
MKTKQEIMPQRNGVDYRGLHLNPEQRDQLQRALDAAGLTPEGDYRWEYTGMQLTRGRKCVALSLWEDDTALDIADELMRHGVANASIKWVPDPVTWGGDAIAYVVLTRREA